MNEIQTISSTEANISTEVTERQAHRTLTGSVYSIPYFACNIAVKKLLEDGILKEKDTIYNPLKSDGTLGKVLEHYHFNVEETDFGYRSARTGAKKADIWNIKDNTHDIVMTVLPSQQKQKKYIIDECLRIANKKFVAIVPITFLAGRKKYQSNFFECLSKVYIYSDRVSIYDMTSELTDRNLRTGKVTYALLVWDFDKDTSKSPEFGFLI